MPKKDSWTWMSKYRLYTHCSKTKNLSAEDREKYFQKSIRHYVIKHEHTPKEYIIQCLFYRKKILDNYPSIDSRWIIPDFYVKQWNYLMELADENFCRIFEEFNYVHQNKYCPWFEKMIKKVGNPYEIYAKIKGKKDVHTN